MTEETELLDAIEHLSSRERAAAIAHWVYTKTAKRDSQWRMRVADEWNDLNSDAREFNLAAIDTWGKFPKIFDAWVKAVSDASENRSG